MRSIFWIDPLQSKLTIYLLATWWKVLLRVFVRSSSVQAHDLSACNMVESVVESVCSWLEGADNILEGMDVCAEAEIPESQAAQVAPVGVLQAEIPKQQGAQVLSPVEPPAQGRLDVNSQDTSDVVSHDASPQMQCPTKSSVTSLPADIRQQVASILTGRNLEEVTLHDVRKALEADKKNANHSFTQPRTSDELTQIVKELTEEMQRQQKPKTKKKRLRKERNAARQLAKKREADEQAQKQKKEQEKEKKKHARHAQKRNTAQQALEKKPQNDADHAPKKGKHKAKKKAGAKQDAQPQPKKKAKVQEEEPADEDEEDERTKKKKRRQHLSATVRARHGDDAFGKIKGMISDMLKQFERDAVAAVDLQEWCVKEVADSIAKKEAAEVLFQKLSDKFDSVKLSSAKPVPPKDATIPPVPPKEATIPPAESMHAMHGQQPMMPMQLQNMNGQQPMMMPMQMQGMNGQQPMMMPMQNMQGMQPQQCTTMMPQNLCAFEHLRNEMRSHEYWKLLATWKLLSHPGGC